MSDVAKLLDGAVSERAALSISGRHILSNDEREFNDKLRIKANQCHHYLQIKGNESTLRVERERKNVAHI